MPWVAQFVEQLSDFDVTMNYKVVDSGILAGMRLDLPAKIGAAGLWPGHGAGWAGTDSCCRQVHARRAMPAPWQVSVSILTAAAVRGGMGAGSLAPDAQQPSLGLTLNQNSKTINP